MLKKLSILVLFVCVSVMAHAQGCSICTKTAGDLGEHGARGLNNGILYLALLPLGIIGTVGFIWWRNNKSQI